MKRKDCNTQSPSPAERLPSLDRSSRVLSYNHDSQPWKLRFYIESIVHRKGYEHLYLYSIYFCMNVLHVNWNIACPITAHFIFLMYHKYIKIQNNIHEKNILDGNPVALVGQVKDFHQHHIWCFPLPCTGEKISLNAEWPAPIPCNDQLWYFPPPCWKKTLLLDLEMKSMVEGTPLLSFHEPFKKC